MSAMARARGRMPVFACAALLFVFGACSERSLSPVRVTVQPTRDGHELQLVVAPGYRVNAVIAPALETDGTVIRFAGPLDPADSLYFAGATTAACPHRGMVRGVVRASVCASEEKVCRGVHADVAADCGDD